MPHYDARTERAVARWQFVVPNEVENEVMELFEAAKDEAVKR